MNSNISVIIRNRNECQYIGFCIQSILDFFINPEIIIIDNNSNDNSNEIINHFKKDKSLNSSNNRFANIKMHKIKQYTPGRALNLGVTKATNKYILIISAHCKLIKFNKDLTYKKLDDNYAVFGNQIPIWNGKRIKKRYIWSNFINIKKENLFSIEENRFFFHNAFSFFNKKILKKYPFNNNLIGKEDRYWANNYIEKKIKLFICLKIV